MKLSTLRNILALIAVCAGVSALAHAALPVEYAIWQEISSPDPSLRCWRMERQIWCANAR